MKQKHTHVAFVLGNSINTLGVIRALGREGVPVYLIQDMPDPVSGASRYAKTFQAPSPREQPEGYVEFLEQLAGPLPEPSVLLPTTDVTVILMANFCQRLEKMFRFNIPPTEVIQKITSKKGFYELAVQHRLSVPRTVSAESEKDIDRVVKELVSCQVNYIG